MTATPVAAKKVTVMPLTDTAIRKAKASGKLADSGGLYLLVKATGGKWWWLDYRRPVIGKRNA